MFNRMLCGLVAALHLVIPCAFALDDPGASRTTEQRLETAESPQDLLANGHEALSAVGLASRLSVSGLFEVAGIAERRHYQGGSYDGTGDLLLATAQLGLGMQLNPYLDGDLSLLFEENPETEDRIEVDEAALNLGYGPWSGRIGRQYLPFGHFLSHFISDPLPLALGETRATALVAGYSGDNWSVSAFAFKGRTDADDDVILDFGGTLRLVPWDGVEIGVGYLSDLADSDAELTASYRHRVGGWHAYAEGKLARIQLSGEILGATRRFAAGDLDSDGDGHGDRPLTWNLEVAASLGETVAVALRLEGSREFPEQPERQYGVALSWSPLEHICLSLEYLKGEYDRGFATVDAVGRPLQRRDLFASQLAIEF